jgi:hypothetical protein
VILALLADDGYWFADHTVRYFSIQTMTGVRTLAPAATTLHLRIS